jgi:hypothetical protein
MLVLATKMPIEQLNSYAMAKSILSQCQGHESCSAIKPDKLDSNYCIWYLSHLKHASSIHKLVATLSQHGQNHAKSCNADGMVNHGHAQW